MNSRHGLSIPVTFNQIVNLEIERYSYVSDHICNGGNHIIWKGTKCKFCNKTYLQIIKPIVKERLLAIITPKRQKVKSV